MINYYIFEKDADYNNVLEVLQVFDNYFIPALSERVLLKELAQKISKNATLILANDGIETIGFSAFYLNSRPASTYWTVMAVKESYRGGGIGSKLIKMMIDYCENANSAGIELEMRSDNIKLLNLYTSFNFRIKDEFVSPFNQEKKYHLFLEL